MKAVLFDFDGVLLDSQIPLFDRLRKTLGYKGVVVTCDDLLKWYIGMSSNEIYTAIIEKYCLDTSIQELRADNHRYNGNYYQTETLIPLPCYKELLKLLKTSGIRTAIVSSTISKNILYALNRLSALRYFDAIVCGDMIDKGKPSPEGYLAASDLLGISPSDCLVIEDSPVGIQAAKNADIPVIGYKGSKYVQNTSHADFQIYSSDDLFEFIRTNIQK